jgi:DNA-binding response OmpR family regulator
MVIADVETNALSLIERVLEPAGLDAWPAGQSAKQADVIVVDVTQLLGDPLAGLRTQRSQGDRAPAIAVAAHFSPSKLRGLFRMGVRDILLKPYRPQELYEAILGIAETRYKEGETARLSDRLIGMKEDVRRRSEEIRMLSEIGRTVASLDDLDQILSRLVEAASYLTDAEEASIYLADRDAEGLTLRASKQAGESQATLQRIRVDDTLVGQVYRSGQPILRQPKQEGGPTKIQTGFMVHSIINVPLRIRREPVGVLGVYNRLSRRNFNEQHLTLLMALADWAGVALERASILRQKGSKVGSAPGAPMLAAPADLMLGIEEAIATLEPFLNGDTGPLSSNQQVGLRQLHGRLLELQQVPVAALEPESSERFVNVTEVINSARDALRLEGSHKGVELVAKPNLNAVLFPGDTKRIYQVVEALIAAAIRRTSGGRVIIQDHRFEVQAGESVGMELPRNLILDDGPWAAITVSDTSSGLSPDTIQALSGRHADPTAGRLGPGLSMGEIRMIVESLRGALWFDQTPASTTVAFALPAT